MNRLHMIETIKTFTQSATMNVRYIIDMLLKGGLVFTDEQAGHLHKHLKDLTLQTNILASYLEQNYITGGDDNRN